MRCARCIASLVPAMRDCHTSARRIATVTRMPSLAPVLAVVSTDEAAACGERASAACLFVYRRTHNDVLARASDWLIARPLKILLIIVLALIASWTLRRVIDRFIAGVERATVKPGIGRPGDSTSLMVTSPLGDRAKQRAETLGAVMTSFGRAIIFVIAGLTILSELDINLGPLLAGAGIVGVAVGFGSQTLVKDFLSGIFMLLEDQFGVGDQIDVGEASGVVEGVSLRTTRLRDVHGTVWHVPNGEIKRIGNKSQEWSRAVLDVAVMHGTEIPRAEQVMKTVADDLWHDENWSPVILAEPEVLGVEGIGTTGITLRLSVRTRPGDQLRLLRQLRAGISEAFQREGIQMPSVQPTPPDDPGTTI
jgi:small conductance mechanosensitive channel